MFGIKKLKEQINSLRGRIDEIVLKLPFYNMHKAFQEVQSRLAILQFTNSQYSESDIKVGNIFVDVGTDIPYKSNYLIVSGEEDGVVTMATSNGTSFTEVLTNRRRSFVLEYLRSDNYVLYTGPISLIKVT